ncbi:hypothetical protein GOV07_02685 [Candidatus Woesearchaeota archaeon]|nr:hypothetical protein [Candidatus Woesearchaeota archaeon]
MRAIISCISECERGKPITDTRHYALIPLANKELILHQIAALKRHDVTILVKKDDKQLQDFLLKNKLPFIHDLPKEQVIIIPGDLLITTLPTVQRTTLLTTANGSEEQTAVQRRTKAEEHIVEAQRLNYPWEFLTANTTLLKDVKKDIDKSVVIEDNVTINGEVIIGKGTIIKAGSYIEGPVIIGQDCIIGPMAHIRPDMSIANNCTIGKTEAYDCIIMKGTVSKHTAYLGHSVLGEDVNVGAFTVTADYRHDGKEHVVKVASDRVASGRRKVGAFIGDHARLAISTSIYPGRKIPAHGTTLPGEVIKGDL